MKISFAESKTMKFVRSEGYNYNFNKVTGEFVRWGRTLEEDPLFAPFPEILDIEISSGFCMGGKDRKGCEFCYKGNSIFAEKTHHMTISEFKTILDKMPWLTQIALGITNIDANPDFFAMMEYARSKNIIPNFTCNGYDITKEIAERVAKLCGAVAISYYDEDATFNAIKLFTDAGMTQVNIHYMLSVQTYDKAFDLVSRLKSDERTKDMNAIVFLNYKPKGTNKGAFQTINDSTSYRKLTDHCMSYGVRFGFDSCSAGVYVKSLTEEEKKHFAIYSESCESFGIGSAYINSKGVYFPCSFTEGEGEWKEGINVLTCNDFIKDVWNNPLLEKYRQASIKSIDCNGCRLCLTFPEINCKE